MVRASALWVIYQGLFLGWDKPGTWKEVVVAICFKIYFITNIKCYYKLKQITGVP